MAADDAPPYTFRGDKARTPSVRETSPPASGRRGWSSQITFELVIDTCVRGRIHWYGAVYTENVSKSIRVTEGTHVELPSERFFPLTLAVL